MQCAPTMRRALELFSRTNSHLDLSGKRLICFCDVITVPAKTVVLAWAVAAVMGIRIIYIESSCTRIGALVFYHVHFPDLGARGPTSIATALSFAI